MQDIFDIIEKEIQELTDSDLRTLIGLLCEAELERNDLPVTAAKWGGNQRAADGGLDVYVDLENQTEAIGEIPRWKTGIQVKQESMPKSKIKKEMSLDGAPKPILAELARNKGAYLIACGRDTNSDKMLKERLKAMRDSCESIPEKADLHLDFFDSNRIATWTRKHPSLVLWVKTKLGTNSSGWQPHDNWSECPDGIDGEFILDDSSKIYDDRNKNTEGLSSEDGLNRIRTLLHEERSCIRLAGLSGVGKTRFAQALYDERIGQTPLSKSIACYTDIAHSPSPTPRDMALQLIALNKRAILIVDNCPPDLHDELSKVCTRPKSKISLLTIEYDIRDNKPERTDVFRMEPSSNDLIEKLISSRFTDINNLEAEKVAEFSEGNARIAIALAETFEKGDAILSLENNELFKRLFHQRNAEDESLMCAAEVLSLVYSFDGETLGSPESELDKLAELAGMPAIELYRHVATLLKRGLAQKRSKWRAVLPHAIANRLAKQALENIPAPFIKNAFDKDGSGRLLKSYTRRLGYLHDSEAAQEIVRGWLQPDGWLGDVSKLNKLGITLLINIAPAAQEDTLEAIERAAYGPNGNQFASPENPIILDVAELMRKIAYEPIFFKRCCLLLLLFASKGDPYDNSCQNLLTSLFTAYLSGTCATIEQRLDILSSCADQESPYICMATPILKNILKAWHFSSHYSFEFGGRLRGFGHNPETKEEKAHWYTCAITDATEITLKASYLEDNFKKIIANKFRGIWLTNLLNDTLEQCLLKINSKGFWREGWLAVRETIILHTEDLPQNSLSKLKRLEMEMQPRTLLEQIQVFAFSSSGEIIEPDFDTDSTSQKDTMESFKDVEQFVTSLGIQASKNLKIFQTILPELVSVDGNMFAFGKGLAIGCDAPNNIWQQLLSAFNETPEDNRKITIFQGFLSEINDRDKNWYETALDLMVHEQPLNSYFPAIQCSMPINTIAAQRLLKSLEIGQANINQFLGVWSQKLDEALLAKLIKQISQKANGEKIALHNLRMIFNINKDKNIGDALLSLGVPLCASLSPTEIKQTDTHTLQTVIKRSFASDSAKNATKEICQKIRNEIERGEATRHDYKAHVKALLEVQPDIVLTELLLDHPHGARFFSWGTRMDCYPILSVQTDSVIKWCEIDPEDRYPLLAEIIPFFIIDNNGYADSISPIALTLLDKTNNYPEILKNLPFQFLPGAYWVGEKIKILTSKIPFCEKLQEHQHECVRKWASKRLKELKKRIETETNAQERQSKEKYESFE
ncbi:hypothetical protein [Maridesulfovibrio sp.]|uniref:hypothetical protein n=1 Tax=Maridesulfovibrio sp. TaxID=2795000 RepID=UPI003AFF8150